MPENETPIVTSDLVEADSPTGDSAEPGVALCLSGGGYRAMLFHLGSLWYLNSCGLLPVIDRVSSVSGGSITAGVLGHRWPKLRFDGGGKATNFNEEIVLPVCQLASTTIDRGTILKGLFTPGSIGNRLIGSYEKHLFGNATLQDLPSRPRFVFNATNLQSGVLFRFSRDYIWDYRVGRIDAPRRKLAEAVAASSAFPPVLSPVSVDLSAETFVPGTGTDLQRPPFTRTAVLSDGGVYDNLGIETAWKRYRTVLISDAGGKMEAEESPETDWARQSMRVLGVIDNQVRSLRKRQVIDAFRNDVREGAYWGIRTNIADYHLTPVLPCPHAKTMSLAETPTRLQATSTELQTKLINWGFAVTDAAIRRHVKPALPLPAQFPYPGGVG